MWLNLFRLFNLLKLVLRVFYYVSQVKSGFVFSLVFVIVLFYI